MRIWMMVLLLAANVVACAQDTKGASPLKSLLLQELRETHNQKNWFVSVKEAAGGLTPEQAAWNDGKNHSVGQLVAHLNFWNAANLAGLKHQPGKKVTNNDDTFAFDPKQWQAVQTEFDQTMQDLEQFVQSADDATLTKIAPTIARIAQHNAYHIAEMVTSRKEQGSWNPDNGVKI
jgi:hypothetical protein